MERIKIKQLLYGCLTRIPFFNAGLGKWYYNSTGGTNSARYCYSVWLRHLIKIHNSGASTKFDVVAELGPGDSLGIGLAALLSGAQKYYALDILNYGSVDQNIQVLEELVQLFRTKSPIPSEVEFANLKPALDNYDFPDHILSQQLIDEMTQTTRIDEIKENIKLLSDRNLKNNYIQYFVPWYSNEDIPLHTIDLIISQSVLEYIEDVESVLKEIKKWLRPGGIMSHQIDLASMRTANTWDGHWTYTDLEWKIMKGNRPFFINRLPNSAYEELLSAEGFDLLYSYKTIAKPTISRIELADRFSYFTEEDLKARGVFILAKKI